jgi:CYTH domain-containing protein
MAIEIERKWLVDEHADVPSEVAGVEPLRQGYIALDADTDASVRLRFGSSGAVLSVKAGTGLARTEIEMDVDASTADQLWEVTAGRRIEKERSRIPVGRFTAELDVYAGALTGLRTVEVEFGSESDAGAFVAPDWFGREVTVEVGWSNAALAVHGRPDR